ncbi:LPXTG cell wall anchor domain-containing protein [Enterococcus faecalis]
MRRNKGTKVLVIAILLALCLVNNIRVFAKENATNIEMVKHDIVMNVGAPKEGTDTSFAKVSGLPENVDAVLTIWKTDDASNKMELISDNGGFVDYSTLVETGGKIAPIKFEGGHSYSYDIKFMYRGSNQDIFKKKIENVKLNLNGQEYPIIVNENQPATVAGTFSFDVKETTPVKHDIVMNVGAPKEGTDTSFAKVSGLPENVDAVLTIWKTDDASNKMELISDNGGFVDYSTLVETGGKIAPIKFEGGHSYSYDIKFMYRGSNQDIFKKKIENVKLNLNGQEYPIIVNENQPATVAGTFSFDVKETTPVKHDIVMNVGAPKEGTDTSFAKVSGLPENVDAVLTIWKTDDASNKMELISDNGGFVDYSTLVETGGKIAPIKFEGGHSYSYDIKFMYRGSNQDIFKKKIENVKLNLNGQEYPIIVNENQPATVAGTFSFDVKETTPVKHDIVMNVGAPKEGTDTSFAKVSGLPENVDAVLTIWKTDDASNKMELISDNGGFVDYSTLVETGGKIAPIKFEGGHSYSYDIKFMYRGSNQDIFKKKIENVKLNLNGQEYPIIVNENQPATVAGTFSFDVKETTPVKHDIVMNVGAPKEGTDTSFAKVSGLPENVDAVLTIWKTDDASNKMELISDNGGFVDYSTLVETGGKIAPIKFEGGHSYSYDIKFMYRGSNQDIFKKKIENVKLNLNGQEYPIIVNENQPATVAGTFSFDVKETTPVKHDKDMAKSDIEKAADEKTKKIQSYNSTVEEKQVDEVKSSSGNTLVSDMKAKQEITHKNQEKLPKTGDNSGMSIYAGILALFGALLLFIIDKKIKISNL